MTDGGLPPDLERALADAYSATGAAWQAGPGRIYDRLAREMVGRSPVPLAGRTVVDVGAGTGAASRAIEAAGGIAISTDVAVGMLRVLGSTPRVAADARSLPVHDGSVGGLVAAFSLNHLPDPRAALAEAGRVVAAGGPIVASAYTLDDTHEAKGAVEAALRELGWEPAGWIDAVRARTMPVLAEPDEAVEVARASGLAGVRAERVEVAFPDLGAPDLVAWRLGMAQSAPFVATLPRDQRAHLVERALQLLGDPPTLVRRFVLLTATAG